MEIFLKRGISNFMLYKRPGRDSGLTSEIFNLLRFFLRKITINQFESLIKEIPIPINALAGIRTRVEASTGLHDRPDYTTKA